MKIIFMHSSCLARIMFIQMALCLAFRTGGLKRLKSSADRNLPSRSRITYIASPLAPLMLSSKFILTNHEGGDSQEMIRTFRVTTEVASGSHKSKALRDMLPTSKWCNSMTMQMALLRTYPVCMYNVDLEHQNILGEPDLIGDICNIVTCLSRTLMNHIQKGTEARMMLALQGWLPATFQNNFALECKRACLVDSSLAYWTRQR